MMIEFRYLLETYTRGKGFFYNKRMDLDSCSRKAMLCEILDIESAAEKSKKRRYKCKHALGRRNLLKDAKRLLGIECTYRVDEVKVAASSLRPDHCIDILIGDSATLCDELECLESACYHMTHRRILLPVFEYTIDLFVCRYHFRYGSVIEFRVSTLPESLAIEIIVFADVSYFCYHRCKCLCPFPQ